LSLDTEHCWDAAQQSLLWSEKVFTKSDYIVPCSIEDSSSAYHKQLCLHGQHQRAHAQWLRLLSSDARCGLVVGPSLSVASENQWLSCDAVRWAATNEVPRIQRVGSTPRWALICWLQSRFAPRGIRPSASPLKCGDYSLRTFHRGQAQVVTVEQTECEE
jgi:hypothetical protein